MGLINMNFGLALAGGGVRGAAHVGILKALSEENLLPSSISGTSAGSIVAGLYAAGLSVQKLEEIVTYLCKKGYLYMDVDFCGILKFIPQILFNKKICLTGLLKGERFHKYLCYLTENKMIAQSILPIVIPAVDINTGKTIAYTNTKKPKDLEGVIWEKDIKLCDAMMASSSVPAVFRPQIYAPYCLVDGGVTNVLPVDLLKATGNKTVIGVDIGEDYEMPEKNTIIEIVSHSFSIMSSNLKECTSTGEKLLLKPPLPKHAGLLTFNSAIQCMESGYEYTKQMMPEIKKALGVN